MVYTVIMDNGRSYDLPPKTLSVAERIESVANLNKTNKTLREKYKVLFDCIVEFLGSDVIDEILGSTKFEECDLSDISITYQRIIDAYTRPEQEFQLAEAIRTFDALPVEKITSFANAASKMRDFK